MKERINMQNEDLKKVLTLKALEEKAIAFEDQTVVPDQMNGAEKAFAV